MTAWSDDFTSPTPHPRWTLFGPYNPPGLDTQAFGPQVSDDFEVIIEADPAGQPTVSAMTSDFSAGVATVWVSGQLALTYAGAPEPIYGPSPHPPNATSVGIRRQAGVWHLLVDGVSVGSAPDLFAGNVLNVLVGGGSGYPVTFVSYATLTETVTPSLSWGGDVQSLWWDGPVEAVYMGSTLVYQADTAPAAVATLELGPETVAGYTFPNVTVYTVPEGAGGVYLVEAVVTKTPDLSDAYVQIQAEVWQPYPGSPAGGFYSRSLLGYLDSGVPFSRGREFVPGDQVQLSASVLGAGSFVLHANVQVFFLGPAQGLPRYTIDHTVGVTWPVESEWVTVHSTVVAQNSMTSGTWTVTWDRPSGVSNYGLRVVLDGGNIAQAAPYPIGTARPTHQSVTVPETVVLEGQTIQFQVYAGGPTVTNRKINSMRALLS